MVHTATARQPLKLVRVWRLAPVAANDVRVEPTVQDSLLADVDAEWLRLHRRAIRGRSMRLTVRYESELVTEERLLAFTGRRVEVWRAEMIETIDIMESFLLRVR